MRTVSSRIALVCLMVGLGLMLIPGAAHAVPFLDNQTQYSNQDPDTETRRSDHFRMCFGQYNRDGATVNGAVGHDRQLAQGNLQMYRAAV